jgi:hypothetical protein
MYTVVLILTQDNLSWPFGLDEVCLAVLSTSYLLPGMVENVLR